MLLLNEKSIAEDQNWKVNFSHNTRGPHTIIVDVNFGGNYTKIQHAIDNASSGDTIYVLPGTYYENIIINKKLALVCSTPGNTTIMGDRTGVVVNIISDSVYIKGFNITGSGNSSGYAGVMIYSSKNCTIIGNNISDNNLGIRHSSSCNNTISNNAITSNNANGIEIYASSDNTNITNNNISNNGGGIHIDHSLNIIIENNTILYNDCGVNSYYSSPTIRNNNISYNNFEGIGDVCFSDAIIGNNTITHNNGIGINNVFIRKGNA